MTITPVADMVAAARARITQIPATEALTLTDDPDVVFVDLRDVRERKNGYVPGSFHCPRGMAEFWVDPASPYHKDIFAQDKRFVFYCASGWRSALTVATLQDMGFVASHITEGFGGWTAAGGPVAHPEQRD
ncbi:sulfurtransferase [Loktanella sp. 3ANDIMAR09]|uniref:rhodanese-like domain-containing protein n=1 Tax=Loktanella sp. 3ANDIMAR09 TaxID=1225657 RepID=UPI0006F9BDBC|nr:rhodanese-like domain-containing protein [Loktanella sp. 3ANDIMAR09]KQI68290.1 sulfurtransferase [Loktanella sp. 3ANDIMAR09]